MKDEKEEAKKDKMSTHHVFWINYDLDSLESKVKEETTNLYLMVKGDSSDAY